MTKIPGIRTLSLQGNLILTEGEEDARKYLGGRGQNAVQHKVPFHSTLFSSHVFSVEGGVAMKSEEHALNWQGRFGHASSGEVGLNKTKWRFTTK